MNKKEKRRKASPQPHPSLYSTYRFLCIIICNKNEMRLYLSFPPSQAACLCIVRKTGTSDAPKRTSPAESMEHGKGCEQAVRCPHSLSPSFHLGRANPSQSGSRDSRSLSLGFGASSRIGFFHTTCDFFLPTPSLIFFPPKRTNVRGPAPSSVALSVVWPLCAGGVTRGVELEVQVPSSFTNLGVLFPRRRQRRRRRRRRQRRQRQRQTTTR